ncbi:hypothetical protein RND81_10G076400 [Saponaria officinalis]|uniref:Uncharacterized protein n=1 Tax=Saponaria officinalis TaxID=3572 RepID=A0AAW1HYS3_SAPOF
MSLVDYATSDDDEEEEHHHHYHASTQLEPQPQPQPQPQQQPQKSLSKRSSGDPPSQNVSPVLPPPFEKLPDASLLLSSPVLSQPVGTDHSARVAAAMAENASRKREANGSSSSSIRGKIPRSQLPHSKNIPETSSGLLTPPQLRGRSNVVTEDISKLFVRRNSNSKEKS